MVTGRVTEKTEIGLRKGNNLNRELAVNKVRKTLVIYLNNREKVWKNSRKGKTQGT